MRRICSVGAVLTFILVFFTGVIFAKKVDLSMAQRVGAVQLQVRKQIRLTQALPAVEYSIQTVRLLKDTETREVLAYILDLKPKGFIAISTDTNIKPFIAYSYHSNFSMEDVQDNVLLHMLKQDMKNRLEVILLTSERLKSINRQLWERYLSEEKSRALVLELADAEQWPEDDRGWLDTTWHQGGAYNNSCPKDPTSFWGFRCRVGCVAVAMGQIIYYWQYPDSVSFDSSDGYVSEYDSERVIRIDEDHELYDFPSFDELNAKLENIGYSENQQEIADFLFACGIAVKMQYSSERSWSTHGDAKTALKDKFGYQADWKSGSGYDFYEVLENDMKEARPAYLGVKKQNAEVGHAIVADGFRSTGEFHLNFGWGVGSPRLISETWYSLPEGIPEGYTIVSGGILGIHPKEENQPPNTPSNPSPADGVTNQAINVHLSWSGGDPDSDPVTYDVYFKANDSNFGEPISPGQSETTYDPGTLSYETHYYWKIVASDDHGASTSGPVWDFTTGSSPNNPPNTPSYPSPSDGATDQSINVHLSWTGGDPDSGDTVTYDVYFKASDSNFGEPTSPGQSGTTYDPGTLSYNTHYYWKIVATDNHGASTEGPVWDFTTGSSGRHENETFSLPAGKWKMISIPFTLDDPSPNAILVDDLGSQNDAVWKLYRWNTANGSYDKYPYVGDFAAAKAFWIVSKDAKEVDTGPGMDVSRETNFVINLPSGWSQIGNPFPFSVDWGEIMVRKDGEEVSISEAQGKEWVRDTIWYWDGQSYLFDQAPSGVLNPYEGYWVRALLDCELLVPPSGAQEARAWEQIVKPKEEFLQVKARVGEIEDSYNFLGFYQTAKDGYDRLDVEEAPPISPYVSLFFPHPEWGKNKGDYTQDIRTQISRAGLKRIWDFQVKTDQINQEIVLEWENILTFPEDLHLYLTDSFSNVLANMREKSSYSFGSSSGLESFKVIATSEALALPEDLDLIEVYSYPNPAHGDGVRFHFHLASSAKLTIKIYSISGELVRTLIKDEVYFPGAYEEFWKEDNDRGERLARGLYIFIIQAGNPAKVMSKSGKIVLLD